MGKLNVANRNYGNYKNQGAVRLLINYITRSRYGAPEDLIHYGGLGIIEGMNPMDIINQICYVQNTYDIRARKGRRMYHEYFTISKEELPNHKFMENFLIKFAKSCCNVYYSMGFQVVYAIHKGNDNSLHIHFAVNTVSYIDGRKWHSFFKSLQEREEIFNQILIKYKNIVYPFVKIY